MTKIVKSNLARIQTCDLENKTQIALDRGGIQTCDPVKIEERTGYKHTKLGWIPQEWETPRIDEVFDFLSTNSLSRSQLNYETEDGVYNIHYGDIHTTYKQPILDFDIENRVPKINRDIVLSQNIDFLKDGDLVIADASEDYEGVGEAIELKNINGKKVTSGLHTFAFRDKTYETAEGFRVYIFRNLLVKKALKTIATGSKVYGISKGNIQKFRIVLPPLPEQQKIAAILSTWDSAIAKQQQLIAAKQEFKKGLMQLLLTGKKRFPEFEGNWETSKLGNYCQFTQGVQIPYSEQIDEEKKGYIRYLYIRDFFSNDFKCYVTDCYPSKIMEKEDLMMVNTGNTAGKVFKGTRGVLSNNAFKISTKKGLSKEFLYYLLSSEFTQLKIQRFFNYGGQPHVGHKNVARIPISIPNLAEQKKIIQIIDNFKKESRNMDESLNQLKNQKKGLMQLLLTGEKRVKI
ncbi:MAG: restriction endonuclease subunit S [Aequorivita sp.]|nr:restriction endonuclease subunit S [Aequorivita sp.]